MATPGPPSTMKRKFSEEPSSAGTHGRRQPQTSCDFCRQKKLKCDRLAPCSSCVARGVECSSRAVRQDGDHSAGGDASPSNRDLLQRVQKLEHALYGTAATPTRQLGSVGPVRCVGKDNSNPPSPTKPESSNGPGSAQFANGHLPVPQLDDRLPSDPRELTTRQAMAHADTFMFIIQSRRGDFGSDEAAATQYGGYNVPRTVWLPPRQDALALLQDYVGNSLHQNRVIYPAKARALFDDVYNRLETGKRVTYDEAAFALIICADGAFYWTKAEMGLMSFSSEDEAARQSLIWRKVAWDLLEHSQRTGTASLEGIQARIVLADMIYNLEGPSSRYRVLLHINLSIARELSLNLIDSPNYSKLDDPITKEIKRRVWWQLTSTDWMMSCTGGTLDRVYTVLPQHMMVSYPRNIDDEELSWCEKAESKPTETATDMSFFLSRIRLAESCREISDMLTIGRNGLDGLRFDQLSRIDRLMEEAEGEFPIFYTRESKLSADIKPHLHVQSQVMYLAVEARRARIFRPFILPGIADQDQRLLRFRMQCLRSARKVMDIASEYLSEQFGISERGARYKTKQPLPRYSPIVIYHLFQACLVIAMHPGLSEPVNTPHAKTCRMALAESLRLLELVSERSPMASVLVRKLVNVLPRRKEDAASPATASGQTQPAMDATAAMHPATSLPAQGLPYQAQPVVPMDLGQPMEMYIPGVSPVGVLDWTTGAATPLMFGGSNGLWDNFMGQANRVSQEDWGQVFDDLDLLSGPA